MFDRTKKALKRFDDGMNEMPKPVQWFVSIGILAIGVVLALITLCVLAYIAFNYTWIFAIVMFTIFFYYVGKAWKIGKSKE